MVSYKQQELFMPTELSVESGLEARLQNVPRATNNEHGYGFVDGSLDSFLSKRVDNYQAVEPLFYGLRDMGRTPGIPPEIYQAMNTAEIAAMLIGVGELKMFGNGRFTLRSGKEINYDELKNKPVEEIISKLVKIGFEYEAVRIMRDKGFTQHSTRRGDLKKRIAELPEDVKNIFTDLFKRERAVSNRQNPSKHDFYDPTIDARNGYDAARTYVSQIISYMSTLNSRNSHLN